MMRRCRWACDRQLQEREHRYRPRRPVHDDLRISSNTGISRRTSTRQSWSIATVQKMGPKESGVVRERGGVQIH
jgi:hypothetical protein